MSKQKRDPVQGADYVMALFGKTLNFLQQRETTSKSNLDATSKDPAMAPLPSINKHMAPASEAQTRLDRIAATCTPLVMELVTSDPSVQQVCVSVIDGFEICHVAKEGVVTSPRHSVITNLTATVARAISTEFRVGQADYILINSSSGRIVIMHRHPKQTGVIVAVIASAENVAGSLIMNTRTACDLIKRALDA